MRRNVVVGAAAVLTSFVIAAPGGASLSTPTQDARVQNSDGLDVGEIVVEEGTARPAAEAPDSPGPDLSRARSTRTGVRTVADNEEVESRSAMKQAFVASDPSPFPTLVDSWTPTCSGTGSDGPRVQAVYAYDEIAGPADYEDAIQRAIANADLTFSESASEFGGTRRVAWATNHGSGNCEASIVLAPISAAGLAEFGDPGVPNDTGLVSELISDGAISGDQNDLVKYLIWTDGVLEPGTEVCGIGLAFLDDVPGALDNFNILTSYAAISDPCWDINGVGSVPAHELMHVLGAVQSSAPNANGFGHCNDDNDLMCYGPSTSVVPSCNGDFFESRFDCNGDDYFNTNPVSKSYLCTHWNSARSPYLYNWDDGYPTGLAAVSSMSAKGVAGGLSVSWTPPPTCPSASAYLFEIVGLGSWIVESTSVEIGLVPGSYTARVTPLRDNAVGPIRTKTATVTNSHPVGDIVLSIVDGRNYGLLGWAMDPDTGASARMRVVIPGVVAQEFDWNYYWADMPKVTGQNSHQAGLFLAQLPPGEHRVCFDAQDANTGGWARLECINHSVK